MKKQITINQLFIMTLTNHWNDERFIQSGWAKEAERLYASKINSPFGHKQIDKISAKQIREWHKSMDKTPVEANRALNVLSKMYSYAIEMELIPQNTSPCAIVKPYRERKRKRFATIDELKNIGTILKREEISNPIATCFIYALLFSGARPRSIERANWQELSEVVFNNETFGVLTFNGKTTSSTGEDEQVILPPHILKIIKTFNRKNKTIFNIKMPREFWDRVRKEAGCPDLWARDLRRTFATIGLSTGESSGVIGELLNHKSANTTKIYTQLIQTKKVEATKNISDTIGNIFKAAK